MLSLSDASGAPYTTITATGSGFAPNETVEVFAGHVGSTPLFAAATADSSGSFSATGREPQHPTGPLDMYAVGESSHKLGATTLSVSPALSMNPATVTPGASTTANFFGFGASESVNIYWNEPRQLLGAASTNALGGGSLMITIPGGAAPGVNVVIGFGETTQGIGIGTVKVD